VSWGNSVGLVTKIRASLKCPDRLCGPPLCSGYWEGMLPGDKAAGASAWSLIFI